MTKNGTSLQKPPTITRRILVIRFSSFGDILQSLSIPSAIQNHWPDAEIHWVTRSDFESLIAPHPHVKKTWHLQKKQSFGSNFSEFLNLAKNLSNENFTHVYDAHNNLRSWLLCFFIKWHHFFGVSILRKSQYRWKRFFLFRFRWNFYPQPFSGQGDLLRPLEKWGIPFSLPPPPQFFFPESFPESLNLRTLNLPENFITLAPSAAHQLKRWPLEHWSSLIEMNQQRVFAVLGGPQDDFLKPLAAYSNVRLLAGQISMIESAWVISKSSALISNDTGPMHFGEQLGHPTIALMGPAPFGFPSRPTTRVMEISLSCRPCSKHGQGPCINPEYQKCLRDIRPQDVQHQLEKMLQ